MDMEEIMDFVTGRISDSGIKPFSREAGISAPTIHHWKNHARGCTLGNIILALDHLGYELVIARKGEGHGQGSAGGGEHQTGVDDGPQAIEARQYLQL